MTNSELESNFFKNRCLVFKRYRYSFFIAASLISLISINDLQRRVARYREMQVILHDSRQQLTFSQTWNSLERIVLHTERALLQEVLEWHSLTSFTESH